MSRNFRTKTSKVAWGFFWLLLAGLILANSFGGFPDLELSIWGIIIAAIAAIVLFHCLISLSLASIPIPLAALYYVFHAQLGLPEVSFWTLALVTLLVTIGLHVMLPRRLKSGNFVHVNLGNHKHRNWKKGKGNYNVHVDGTEVIIDGEGEVVTGRNHDETNEKTKIEEGDDENNPYISVSFGAASRYLHADRLESAELNCSFGSLEVYFDNVTLGPNGAEVNVNCSFGSIEIYVPSHWRVIDDMNSSLANAEVSRKLQGNDNDAPTLRVTGSVSLGNVEVNRIK